LYGLNSRLMGRTKKHQWPGENRSVTPELL
jgi:hypothetical protein